MPISGANRMREPKSIRSSPGNDPARPGVDGEADAGAKIDSAADLPADPGRGEMGVAGAVDARRRRADAGRRSALKRSDPVAAPAELEVHPFLDTALGEAGVDVVDVDSAEQLLAVSGGRGGGESEGDARNDRLHGRANPPRAGSVPAEHCRRSTG